MTQSTRRIDTKPKRCWNCRTRKTACDRTQPACSNCRQRGVKCLGYGLKLSWPRGDDQRRTAQGNQHRILPIESRELEFVNATVHDIQVWDSSQPHYYLEQWKDNLLRPSSPLGVAATTTAQLDPFLATKGYSPIGRILSSAHNDMPELYLLLMKMSLADETPSALAARHAIAGLSYQHLGQHKTAAMHQTKSLRALQTVIGRLAAGDLEATQALRAMAASMLLNIFETLNFDRSPLHWTIFFCGCKKILNLFHVPHTTYEGDPALILDWIFYHDTLYKFSERHWYPRHPRLVQLAKQEKIISKAKLSPMRHIILPITGCSLHLLVLLSQIVDAVHDRTDPRHLSPSHLATIHSLEQQLSALTQLPSNRISAALNADDNKHAHEPAAGLPPEESAETRQAELYRLAAHIYLLRVARAAPPTDPTVLALVDKALDLLRRSSPGCSRPWPLFVVALEARTDAQRRVVSDALRDGLARRPLGNLQIVRRMVHAAWVQIDLHAESGTGEDVMGVYNTVVSGLRVPPSFT